MKNRYNTDTGFAVLRFRPRLSQRLRALLWRMVEGGALGTVAAIFAILIAYGWANT